MRQGSAHILVFAVGYVIALAGCDFITGSATSTAPVTPKDPNTYTHTGSGTSQNTNTKTITPAITTATEVGLNTTLPLGPTGGSIHSPGGGAIVVVPGGALKNPNTFTVLAQDENAFPEPASLASHVYDIGPSGLALTGNVTITLKVLETIPIDMRPTLAFLNDQNAWQVVPGSTYDALTHLVHGSVKHFTNFAVYLVPTDGTGCAQSPDPNALCSPVTCDPNRNACNSPAGSSVYYTVGGNVSGLGANGSAVSLLLNKAHLTVVKANGTFAFGGLYASGSTYAISILQQPNNTFCTVANGNGTVSDGNVANIAVSCVPTVALTTVITGLAKGTAVVLQNGALTAKVASPASRYLWPRVTSGQNYNVTVIAQPTDQFCSVSGAGVAAATDVTLTVTCANLSFALGGVVSGLLPNTAVRLHNGNDTISVLNGTYAFPTVIHGGNDYNVTLVSPTGQSCSFGPSISGAGVMPAGTITGLNVYCTQLTFALGGSVSGWVGNTNLVLHNGNDTVSTGNGAFVFPAGVPYASQARVTITSPPGQTCLFSNGVNAAIVTMGTAPIMTLRLICTQNTYTIGGTVAGLMQSTTVALHNNGTTSYTGNGNFLVPGRYTYGTDYNLTLVSPTGQTCVFTQGQAGTVGADNVGNVTINCTTMTFTLGGVMSGLVANANATLTYGTEVISVGNGNYVFPNPVPYSAHYVVTITPPASQVCKFPLNNSVANMGLSNVSNINVSCAPMSYPVGGNVSGLVFAAKVVLRSGNDAFSVGNAVYKFPTTIAYNSNYSVSLVSPSYHSCVFSPSNANVGIMPGMAVTDVNVVCTPASFSFNARVSGLLANSNVILDNGFDTLSAGNGNYLFPTQIPYATPYHLTATAAAGHSCGFSATTQADATMPAGPVTAGIVCSPLRYTIGGTITGLSGTLKVANSNQAATFTASGPFTMGFGSLFQSSYSIRITAQPAHQLCTVTNGNGVVPAGNVTNVAITCAANYAMSDVASDAAAPSTAAPSDFSGDATQATVIAAASSVGSAFVGPDATLHAPGAGARAGNAAYLARVQTVRHRVLLTAVPARATSHAEIVVGQPTPECTQNGLDTPQGASLTDDGRLLVADTGNHRVLVWNSVPQADGTGADLVLGQPDFSTCATPGDGAEDAPSVQALYQPFDVWSDGVHVMVADTAAARVLIWNTFPSAEHPLADAVLGRPAQGLDSPTGVTSDGHAIYITEYAPARLTQWSGVPWKGETPVLTAILGHPDASAAVCNRAAPVPADALCGPTGVTLEGRRLIVTDTPSERLVIFESR